MHLARPTRSTRRRASLATALAIAAGGFAFAGAAEAKPCPPDICDPPVVVKELKFKWPPGPVCLSCPNEFKLIDYRQELVIPQAELLGNVRFELEHLAPEALGAGP
jgi:hypothetical protein